MKNIARIVLMMFSLHALGAPIKLTSINGQTVAGEILQKTDSMVVLRTEFGEVKISMDKLNAESRAAVKLAAVSDSAAQERIASLEAELSALKAENARLRAALESRSSSGEALPAASGFMQSTPRAATSGMSSPAQTGGYWISSTGKRHKAGCRYYGTGNGRAGSSTEGVACKICGG